MFVIVFDSFLGGSVVALLTVSHCVRFLMLEAGISSCSQLVGCWLVLLVDLGMIPAAVGAGHSGRQ